MKRAATTASTVIVLFSSLVLASLCLFLGIHFAATPMPLTIQIAISIVMAIPMSLSLAWLFKKRACEYWKNALRGVVIFVITMFVFATFSLFFALMN